MTLYRYINAEEKAKRAIDRFEKGLTSQEIFNVASAIEDLANYIQSQIYLFIALKSDPYILRSLFLAVARCTSAYRSLDDLIKLLEARVDPEEKITVLSLMEKEKEDGSSSNSPSLSNE